MLEELDDDVQCLLNRLRMLDSNLDVELERLYTMIGDAGPRSSTRYQEIASKLKNNLQSRVSEHRSYRSSFSSSQGTDLFDLASDTPSSLMNDIGMGTPGGFFNGMSDRTNNRSSRTFQFN